ncbi:hypothetical protein D4764_09G0010600 [Takifugu flavidus]|uniref:Uncharacterized protein n=1 Tax=Takifugu flavidus TaxID=433684 RepID=A0A5C6MRD4_9TELE|nr:hypothetical protein D4764_09G0010600 [Takifugu flavidus]
MALRDCFDTTDWDVFCEPHGEDIDGLTTCITDYINFCVENTVPTCKVRCFPNNKPWATPELKALLNEKKRVFKSGDKEELRRVQKVLRRGIRRGKDSYRRKLEERLKKSNAREVWRGIKTISGHTKDSGRGPESGGLDWANELNFFFNRFDCAAPPPSSPTHQSPDLTVLSHHHSPSPLITPPTPAALFSHHVTSTSDFSYNSDSCHLQKFSDDTAIVGHVSEGNELEYREVITNFVA